MYSVVCALTGNRQQQHKLNWIINDGRNNNHKIVYFVWWVSGFWCSAVCTVYIVHSILFNNCGQVKSSYFIFLFLISSSSCIFIFYCITFPSSDFYVNFFTFKFLFSFLYHLSSMKNEKNMLRSTEKVFIDIFRKICVVRYRLSVNLLSKSVN